MTPAPPPPVDALAADGTIVRLRPVTALDAGALLALHERASPESLRLRFFSVPGPAALAREVARLTRPPADDHAAMLVERGSTVLAVASFEVSEMPSAKPVGKAHPVPPDPGGSGGSGQAEFAVFVDSAYQGHGIGTLLLEHLSAWAARMGVLELTGQVLAANSRMLRVATDLSGHSSAGDRGGATKYSARPADGVVNVDVPTQLDDAVVAAADRRDRSAQRASLRALLAPDSVAVVGATGEARAVLRAMRDYGYTGRLYQVAPAEADFASIAAAGEAVDLAVVAVAAEEVPEVAAGAVQAGVRAMVVLAEGYAEAGPQGAARQIELARQAREGGIRLVGPNCLGVITTDPAVRLAATLTPALPAAGALAVAVQSGAVGVALLDHASRAGVGVSNVVFLGNKADVSGNDLLAYWYDDPATRAVALCLESFGNPRRFGRVVRALASRKPVLAVFSGRSSAGRRAASAHGGAPGGVLDGVLDGATDAPGIVVDTLFDQAGVIRVDHIGQLLDVARLVVDAPALAGDRLAVIGNAGGVNMLAADAAEAAGLRVPPLSAPEQAGLSELASQPDNPLDLGSAATAASFAQALTLLHAGGEVDAALVVVAATRTNDAGAILAGLAPAVDSLASLPVAVVVLGAAAPATLGQRRVPVYDLPERAVAALGLAARYWAWRRQPLGAHLSCTAVDTARAREQVSTLLAGGGGWLPPEQVVALAGCYGIELADGTRHGLRGRRGYRGERSGAVQLAASVGHDPLFGSLVRLGVGGATGGLLADRSYRLVPMTDRDPRRMWQALRCAELVAQAGPAALEDLLARLGQLAEELPEVAQLELDLRLRRTGELDVLAGRLRLARLGTEPDAILRALRRP